MKVITRLNTNEIILISSRADIVSNGILTDTCVIGVAVGDDGQFSETIPNIYNVTTIPENVQPMAFCYTTEKGFYENVTYIDEVKRETIDAYNLELMAGGIL